VYEKQIILQEYEGDLYGISPVQQDMGLHDLTYRLRKLQKNKTQGREMEIWKRHTRMYGYEATNVASNPPASPWLAHLETFISV